MEELKNKLIADCNKSQLPIEAVYFIVKDLWRDVEEAFAEYKRREAREAQYQKKMESEFGAIKELPQEDEDDKEEEEE